MTDELRPQPELKPCPFCGSVSLQRDRSSPGVCIICCDECRTIGPEAPTDLTAITAWNKRLPNAIVPDDSTVERMCAAAWNHNRRNSSTWAELSKCDPGTIGYRALRRDREKMRAALAALGDGK